MLGIKRWVCFVLSLCAGGVLFGAPVQAINIDKSELYKKLSAEEIKIPFPTDFERWPEPGQANNTNTTTANRSASNTKIIRYKTTVWGGVVASFDDFKAKVAETLNDSRGWVRAGLSFVEVADGADLDIILSDPAHLEALPGCSGELSCTTWSNQVIINDVRWREGTEFTRAGGMSTRDYQHMVVNHEMGHWLGHYSHIDDCTAANGFLGGPAPIMLQQSTGLRSCASFNPWPLTQELWTLK